MGQNFDAFFGDSLNFENQTRSDQRQLPAFENKNPVRECFGLFTTVRDVQRGNLMLPSHPPDDLRDLFPGALVESAREVRPNRESFGRAASARPRATLCRSPPLSPCGLRSSNLSIPKASASSCTRPRMSSCGQFLEAGPKARCWRTVFVANNVPSCGTKPISRRPGGKSVTSPTGNRIRPRLTRRNPQIASSKVVLPLPVRPMSTA